MEEFKTGKGLKVDAEGCKDTREGREEWGGGFWWGCACDGEGVERGPDGEELC